jgi:hypothetical protein
VITTRWRLPAASPDLPNGPERRLKGEAKRTQTNPIELNVLELTRYVLCSANEPNEVILLIINGLEEKIGPKSQNMDGPLLSYCGFMPWTGGWEMER